MSIVVPGAPPQAVQARSENPTSASVSWQAPPCVQTNGEIVRYEYSLEGVDPWATADTKVLTAVETRGRVDGLTPFTRYRVKVRAYTARGAGPWSPEVFVTTKGAGEQYFHLVDRQSSLIHLMIFRCSATSNGSQSYRYHCRYCRSSVATAIPTSWRN